MSIYITALLWILFCISGTVNAAEKQPALERAYAAYDLDAVRNTAKFMAKKAVELNLGEPISPMTFTNFGRALFIMRHMTCPLCDYSMLRVINISVAGVWASRMI